MILSLFSLALGLFLYFAKIGVVGPFDFDFISYIFLILGIIGVIWHFYKKPSSQK